VSEEKGGRPDWDGPVTKNKRQQTIWGGRERSCSGNKEKIEVIKGKAVPGVKAWHTGQIATRGFHLKG